jgi:hypothetical protein
MKDIKLAHNVSIPVMDYAIQGNAMLGIKESGKSYSATRMAEQLLDNGIPFVALDPIGVWRFLKVPGLGKGYKVVVAGGQQPDLPLSPQSAPAIVRAAMRDNIPLVIDLFDVKLSKADWRRIVEETVQILLHENRSVRHIFIEEAEEFVPQRIQPDQAKVYNRIEQMARMGGNASLGYTLVSPRAEGVNKSVLELCDGLFLHRQRGKNSILNLGKWLDAAGSENAKEIQQSLATLDTGECWAWLRGEAKPVRLKLPQKSSLHPDRRKPIAPEKLAAASDVSAFVDTLKGSLEKVIAEAKANDPAELKKEIATLRRELTQKPKVEAAKPLPAPKPIEVPVLVETELHHIKLALQQFRDAKKAIDAAITIVERIDREVLKFTELTGKNKNHWTLPSLPPRPALLPRIQVVPSRPLGPTIEVHPNGALGQTRPTRDGESLPIGERKILTACAQFGEVPKEDLTVLTGFKRSTRDAYIQRLREKCFAEDFNGVVTATDEGLHALGHYEPLPVGDELRDYWLARLPEGERRILEILVQHYPDFVAREDLEEPTGFKRSTRDAYLQRMKPKRVVEFGNGTVRASEKLFS